MDANAGESQQDDAAAGILEDCSLSGATEDEWSDHSEQKSRSSDYSQCRSANFSCSSHSWLQSPEHELFYSGSGGIGGSSHKRGGSGDPFVDALDDYFDAESQLGSLSSSFNASYFPDESVKATGRPDLSLCDYREADYEDKHPVEAFHSEVLVERSTEAVASEPPSSCSRERAEDLSGKQPYVAEEQDSTGTLEEISTATPEVIADSEKKKCVMRLGSKEAERLLQLDVSELVRPSSSEVDRIRWSNEHLGPDELSRYVEELHVKETYMDTVYEMEEILLDTGDNRGTLWAKGTANRRKPQSPASVYDGLWKVDSVQVIGARQMRGGASLSERVVGIKEHTVYRIRVKSGEHEWDIQRRYRDFIELFQQLKAMFNGPHSRIQLPSPWENVAVESRKLFGNTSPDVVEVRSALLQVCLHSALQAGIPISSAAPLLRFLFPSPSECRANDPGNDRTVQMQLKEFSSADSSKSSEGQQDQAPFGTTIRLILQLPAKKTFRQQLLDQRNLCAGCYEQLNSTSFVNSLGWGKPKFCEYTGQVFCTSCHLNEKAIIPAKVLQAWDFTPGNVSQLAKAYLDSIHDQPMLCVSAVNPRLYSRVPILANVNDMRGMLSKLAACIRCPFRHRLQQLLGPRRYLLDHNDFYSLKDLADLSKGAFAGIPFRDITNLDPSCAVLPGLLKTHLNTLVMHIRDKCSVCMELGEACGAGPCCDWPSQLIYPYQVEDSHRCQLCATPYHKACFKIIETCSVCTMDAPQSHYQSLGLLNDGTPCLSSNNSSSNDLPAAAAPAAAAQTPREGSNKPSRKNIFSGLFTKRERQMREPSSAMRDL